MMKKNGTPNLPQEIITNILVLLPVKSLIRFQCVCKNWKNLFRTPSFIAEHLRHSAQQNPLFIIDSYISEGNPWNLSFLNHEMQVSGFQNRDFNDVLRSGRVHSSNGLLFVELGGKSYHPCWLWNPAIRVVRMVPQSLNYYGYELSSVAFGFSPIVNDYMIVKLFSSASSLVLAEVYLLRMGLWRKVEVGDLEPMDSFLSGPFPRNGAIFWITQRRGLPEGKKTTVDSILSFDIAKEVFTSIPLPPMTSGQGYYYTLASYENRLAMFCPCGIENSESYVIVMWVLEEWRDPSKERWSWAKIYTSRPNPYRFIIIPEIIRRNEIVCSVEALPEYQIEGEDEIYGGKVVFCNLTTDEFNAFDFPKRSYCHEILDYVESLVLLDNIHIRKEIMFNTNVSSHT